MVCIIIMVMLSGCGGGSKQSNMDAANKELEKAEDEINKIAEESGSNVTVNLGQMGSNLKLPDNFPRDVVPLLDDANISNVIDNKDNNAIGIIYTTAKKYDEVGSFYQEVLKDADNFNNTQLDSGSMMGGTKDGYRISITAVAMEGKGSSVMIDVNYSERAEADKLKNTLASGKSVDLPDGYPEDKFPILQGDKVTDGFYSETEYEKYFDVTLISNKSMKDIIDGYENSWSDIVVEYKNLSSSDFQFEVRLGDDYSNSIDGEIKDNESKIVEYRIHIHEYKK